MKKLLLFLSLSSGIFASRNTPFQEFLRSRAQAFVEMEAKAQEELWTIDGLREHARLTRAAPSEDGKPGLQMVSFVRFFGVEADQMYLCRSLITSLRPEIERALAGGAQEITVQLTLPTGQFNRTIPAEYVRELIRTYDELNRDMPATFERGVEGLLPQFRPSNAELKRQVEAANATVNGVPVQVTVYKRPVPAFVWALVAVGAAACAYSAYTYFFAREEKAKPKEA